MTIREIREKESIMQKEVALNLNIKQNTLSQYENGIRQPNIEILPKMAQTLNCSIEELVFAIIETQKQNATKNKQA